MQEFKQDTIFLQQDKASAVSLSGNKINRLEAIVGFGSASTSRLYINGTNTIQEANLEIRKKSELVLDNITIPKLKYQFSDSAKATFSGRGLGILVP